MKIVISQRIDTNSDYDDIPFVRYHFPKRYRNQISPGDSFVYYQGDRSKKENRYYFGVGIVGAISMEASGKFFYAEILEGYRFPEKVPIYDPKGGFIETLGFEDIRIKSTPSWQNSVRRISDVAFARILSLARCEFGLAMELGMLDLPNVTPLEILKRLNEQFRGLSPGLQSGKVNRLLDRGTGVTNALKLLLGASCQLCGWRGFKKAGEGEFIEAHHIEALSNESPDSLCTENIVLLCPNCHRQIHYGRGIRFIDLGRWIEVDMDGVIRRFEKNSIDRLTAEASGLPG